MDAVTYVWTVGSSGEIDYVTVNQSSYYVYVIKLLVVSWHCTSCIKYEFKF